MPTTATPIFPQTITNTPITIVNATGTGLVTVYTGGSNGSKVENLLVTNTDTAAYTLQFFMTISATNYLLGSVNIPVSAGNTSAAPSINPLSTAGNWGPALNLDSNGNPYIYVANGSVLKAAVTSTVTNPKTITIFAQGDDF